MRRILSKHKTTIVGIVAGLMVIGASIRWTLGQIDASELGVFCSVIAGFAVSLIGILSKDGQYKKNNDV